MRRSLVLLLAVTAAATASSSAVGAFLAPGRATLETFARAWSGHTRTLKITREGHGRESIYSGCCDPVLNITFRLSRPRGTASSAAVTATVTGVWVRDRSAYSKAHPPPQVGERRTLRLRNGVITETLTGTNYCDGSAESAGKCGA